MRHYPQGDVNLHEITEHAWTEVLAQGRPIDHGGRYVLARREATGSEHALAVEQPAQLSVYEFEGAMYLRLEVEAPLQHTHDHVTLRIEPGCYRQIAEREIDHFADSVIRRVVD